MNWVLAAAAFVRTFMIVATAFPVAIKLSFEPEAAATHDEPRDTPQAAM